MAATTLWNQNHSLDPGPGRKRRLDIKYVNLELSPSQREASSLSPCDDYNTDESDLELQFSDDSDEDNPPISAKTIRPQTETIPCVRLGSAIGDCLRLSSSSGTRQSDLNIRWTTSDRVKHLTSRNLRHRLSYSAPFQSSQIKISYLHKDGQVIEKTRSDQDSPRDENCTKIPAHLHPHSMHDILLAADTAWGLRPKSRAQTADARSAGSERSDNNRLRSRRITVGSRRPHTVAPAVPRFNTASTASYVSNRLRYLLDARASITPTVLKDEFLPLLSQTEDVFTGETASQVQADLEEGGITLPSRTVLTGRHCRRFRKRVMAFIRQRRVVSSFQDTPQSQAVVKLKTAGRIVMTLVRMLKAIIANTDDLTKKSAAEVQWQALYSNRDPHKFAFNKSIYTRERAIEKLPMWSLDILQKDPGARTDTDIRKLNTLLKGMRCYDKFTEKIQNSLCQTFSLMCFQEGRVIIRQGHVGQNFYMIYSGSVFVNVNDKNAAGESFVKNEAVLSKGDSFGELALLQDIRRTATIVVRETCELLVVQKRIFSQVCPRIFEIELEEKLIFMNKMLLFSRKWWDEDALKTLALTAQIQDYKTNKVIVTDSVREDWIYICLEGKCQVIRCLEIDKKREASPKLSARRRSVVLLSDEILDLLGSFPETSVSDAEKVRRQSRLKTPDSTKEKLLGSLGLDYVNTGRREKVFIAEMEQAEQKKALEAARGYVSLTSYMKHKLEQTSADLVFLHVGVVNAMEIFDLSCILSPYHRLNNSSFMLVSGGARMLRIRRDRFHECASPAALEYSKNQAFKDKYPSDEALLKSYREKSGWEEFKSSIVRDVKSTRPLMQDRRRFYRKDIKVKDKQSQIWTFLCDNRIIELKTLKKKEQIVKPEMSKAVARALAHDHRPEVVRTVPENMVMRRRSSVRFSPDMPIIHRMKPTKREEEESVEEEAEIRETPEFDKGKRRSVTIKLPAGHFKD